MTSMKNTRKQWNFLYW